MLIGANPITRCSLANCSSSSRCNSNRCGSNSSQGRQGPRRTSHCPSGKAKPRLVKRRAVQSTPAAHIWEWGRMCVCSVWSVVRCLCGVCGGECLCMGEFRVCKISNVSWSSGSTTCLQVTFVQQSDTRCNDSIAFFWTFVRAWPRSARFSNSQKGLQPWRMWIVCCTLMQWMLPMDAWWAVSYLPVWHWHVTSAIADPLWRMPVTDRITVFLAREGPLGLAVQMRSPACQ